MEGLAEARLDSVEERLDRIEHALGLVAATEATPPVEVAPSVTVDDRGWTFDLDQRSWEDLLGGRVFAWLGGIALVVGVAFFVGMAINRGWIGIPARMALAGAGSTALLLLGVWLHERGGRTQAARSAVAAALAAQYATLCAATVLYALVSPAAGLLLAGVVGASGLTAAVRWRSPVLAAIAMVGALLAPVLVGAGTTDASLAFVALALVAVTALLLREGWGWLALVSFLVSAPQLLVWIHAQGDDHVARSLLVLTGFSLLFLVAAVGHAVRTGERLSLAAMSVAFLDVSLTAAAGWSILHEAGHHDAANAWLLGSAAAHVVLGAGVTRFARPVGMEIVALGLAQSAVGLALVLHGPALVAAWSAHAVALAWIARTRREDALLVPAGLFLAGAIVHMLAVDAPPIDLVHGAENLAVACAAAGIVAASAAACAWFLRDREYAAILSWIAGFAVVYVASLVVVDRAGAGQSAQIALSALWSLAGVALVAGLLRDVRSLRSGGMVLLCIAVTKVFLYDLSTLASGYRVVSFLALGMLLLVGAFAYQRTRRFE